MYGFASIKKSRLLVQKLWRTKVPCGNPRKKWGDNYSHVVTAASAVSRGKDVVSQAYNKALMATASSVPTTKISGGSFLLEERQPNEVFTPEDFSEQHQLIAQTAEEFAVNEILPQAEKIEHKDFSITRALLKKAGDLGLSGVEIPEAYGGLEMDKVTAAVIADSAPASRSPW